MSHHSARNPDNQRSNSKEKSANETPNSYADGGYNPSGTRRLRACEGRARHDVPDGSMQGGGSRTCHSPGCESQGTVRMRDEGKDAPAATPPVVKPTAPRTTGPRMGVRIRPAITPVDEQSQRNVICSTALES